MRLRLPTLFGAVLIVAACTTGSEELADSMARWRFGQEEPGQRVQNYISAISGVPNFGGTQTTRSSDGGGKGADIAGLGLQAIPLFL